MRIEEVHGRPLVLKNPISLVVETVEELNWLYFALSRAVHAPEVFEDSKQQKFYGEAHVRLNEFAAQYRRNDGTS